MRPKTQTFEQLVNQNREELMQDEQQLEEIEKRLEKRQSKPILEDNEFMLYNHDNIG